MTYSEHFIDRQFRLIHFACGCVYVTNSSLSFSLNYMRSVQDEGVAMEACEFWWEFLKNRESAVFLLQQHDSTGSGSVLSALIPALIARFPVTTEQVKECTCVLFWVTQYCSGIDIMLTIFIHSFCMRCCVF